MENTTSPANKPSSKVCFKLVYCLRVRANDSEEWSEVEYYFSRRERDYTAANNRIVGGLRTHSYEERKTPAEIAKIKEAPFFISQIIENKL